MKAYVANTTLALLMCACPVAFGSVTQSAGQDMKRAGREVGVATEHTGRAVERAAVKTGREVKWGTRKIIHKSARATEKGAAAVKNKTRL